jgi:hypothetical protein
VARNVLSLPFAAYLLLTPHLRTGLPLSARFRGFSQVRLGIAAYVRSDLWDSESSGRVRESQGVVAA